MRLYTFSEARQKLASLLDKARSEGEVRIRRRDGSVFTIRHVDQEESPLEVEGVQSSLSADEIVEYIREGREEKGRGEASNK